MEKTLVSTADIQTATVKAITVNVNTKPVVFHEHEATGADIKATAVAQGVAIQSDFVLFEIKHGGELKQIGDAEAVRLHDHEAFRAVAPDDNSGDHR